MSIKLKIVRDKAKRLGLKGQIFESDKKDKKYYYLKDGKKTYFGGNPSIYKDFLDYSEYDKDLAKKKRKAYRLRHSNIILNDGSRAIDKKYSPAFFSYYLLW